MTHSRHLLDHLVDLTAIRDLELLEFSLLRTLYGFLHPKSVSILTLDAKGNARRELLFANDSCLVRNENLTVSEEMREADRFLAGTDSKQHMARGPDGVRYVIPLLATRSTRGYLLLTLANEFDRLDAHLMAGVLQIYRNFCSLLHHAQTDQLTGLANRKTFDECVSKIFDLLPVQSDAVEDDRRQNRAPAFWLVIADIDHFKSINDRFGHLYGDEVLLLLAQIMKGCFREDDLIFRFGGEEFVMIVRCPDQAACRAALERFRTAVETATFPQVGRVTVSLGAVRMSREVFIATLLDYADQALYHSKNSGRNRCTLFEEMVDQGLAKTEEVVPGGIEFF